MADQSPSASGSTQTAKAEETPFLPYEEKIRIETALAKADRVMLCPQERVKYKTDPDRLETPLVDICGADKVRELIEAMDLGAGRFEDTCACLGNHRLVFMKGDRFLFELTYHHLSRLRGGYGHPYWGDIHLSDKGAKAVIQWFTANGFPVLEESQTKMDAYIAERAADHAKLAALLPEKARSWLPAYDHNSYPWKWERDKHVAGLLGCFSNEQEGILTLWRMLGMYHKAPHGMPSVLPGEPASWLLKALSYAKPESLLAADGALSAEDANGRVGAFLHAFHCLDNKALAGEESVILHILNRHMTEGLDSMDEGNRYWIVNRISLSKSKPAPALLATELKRVIAKRSLQPETPSKGRSTWGDDDTLLLKLLALSFKLGDSTFLSTLDRAQSLPTLSEHERKVCGLLSKLASGTPEVCPEDLLVKDVGYVNLSLLSWRAYRTGGPGEPSLRMLASALRSPSYEVKEEARKLLREAGIEQEESSTEGVQWSSVKNKDEPLAAEKVRLENAVKAATTDISREAALKELGRFLLTQGEYEQALIAFRKAGPWGSLEATLAGVALGRPNEGFFLSQVLTRSDEQANKFVAMATAECAIGRFDRAAQAFQAASTVAGWDEAECYAMAAELIGRLQEQPPAAPSETCQPRSQEHVGKEDAVEAFVRGAITKEVYLERRKTHNEPATDAFTWWVIAQMTRINKDKAGEVEALHTGTALDAHASVWQVLMVNRARELELE